MAKLTARTITTAKPGRHSDGGGLLLQVSPTGVRKWILRYQISGRRRDLVMGHYPEVTLAAARAKAAQLRSMARSGQDPAIQPATPLATPTFTQAAARYIRSHRHGWKNRKHARQWVATMKTYARPIIGAKAVDAVTTEDILAILKAIWTTKTETAKRVQGRVENILDWCAARQYRDQSNPARWRGHLDHLLPKPTKVRRVQHHPAMPYTEVPRFLVELAAVEGVAALALRFAILTATRTGETLGARWEEIDLEAAVWTIPAERMKAAREHRVPLTEAALSILRALPQVSGEVWVFPGARQGRPLSAMALLMTMRRLGYGVNGTRGAYVPHGFRSSFRDWCGEVSSYPREVAEAALAHVNADKVESAYARGDLFMKRRRLMAAWSDWCARSPASVSNFSNRARGTSRSHQGNNRT
ncbi:integrase [Thiocapsa imhoffii]|uniref:Integrase n=1 Tax=Thiocapsa imhoffii TaxID=382777 RepID=A0A9X0WFH4_9GAMM|nr:site-specific integrase [Thiocapsa imhoffii]MBK1643586.1 integrase [Thiocapsa imhoffii]